MEVTDAEVFAVAKVLEAIAFGSKAPLDPYDAIVIYVDSQAAILQIQSPQGNWWAHRIQAVAYALWDYVEVRIH